MNRIFRISKLLIAAAAVFPLVGFAATQGSVGDSSTGNFLITATIPGKVRISNLVDLTVPVPTDLSSTNASEDVCVYSNNTSGGYKVTATSSEGTFDLDDTTTGTNTVAYEVWWNDVTGTTGNTQLSYNTQLSGQTGGSNSITCNGGSNLTANVQVKIDGSALQAVPADTYDGTLIITIDQP